MLMKQRYFSAKKIAVLAIFTALSLITFLIENLFPPLLLPGAKLGLSNTFSFAALVIYSPVEAFIIVGIRTLLGAVFAGNISAVMYSFTGGMVSMAVSSLLIYLVFPKLSIIAVSIVAAVFHNLTQCTVYVLITSTPSLFVYAPYLMLIGIASGAFIGGVVWIIFRRVPVSVFENALGVKHSAAREHSPLPSETAEKAALPAENQSDLKAADGTDKPLGTD